MATSLAAIAALMLAPARLGGRLSRGRLPGLGDASFGVYLCHMAVLWVLRAALGPAGLSGLAGPAGLAVSLLEWAAVLALSALFVLACQRLLPKRLLGVIGFV